MNNHPPSAKEPLPKKFPAEWQQQAAILLVWPHDDTDWSDSLESVEQIYVQIVKTIAHHEKVLIICRDTTHQSTIRNQLDINVNNNQIIFYIAPYNDTWVRDYGPISIIKNNIPSLLNFQFNGWGNKFDSKLDNKINSKLTKLGAWHKQSIYDIPFTLEGGSIDSNGEGTLLTTSACLLNQNRNAQFNQEAIEALLIDNLGAKKILWLNHGYMVGDDTDCHIDTLARFCDTETIVYMACKNRKDEHFDSLKQMEQELQAFKTLDNKPFNLIPIYIPSPIYDQKKNRLPASYVNFLITNGPVLLPVYNDNGADQHAISQLNKVMPQREIIPIDCTALIQQHGSLHCITMQLLEGTLSDD